MQASLSLCLRAAISRALSVCVHVTVLFSVLRLWLFRSSRWRFSLRFRSFYLPFHQPSSDFLRSCFLVWLFRHSVSPRGGRRFRRFCVRFFCPFCFPLSFRNVWCCCEYASSILRSLPFICVALPRRFCRFVLPSISDSIFSRISFHLFTIAHLHSRFSFLRSLLLPSLSCFFRASFCLFFSWIFILSFLSVCLFFISFHSCSASSAALPVAKPMAKPTATGKKRWQTDCFLQDSGDRPSPFDSYSFMMIDCTFRLTRHCRHLLIAV